MRSDLKKAAVLALDALENHTAIKHPQQRAYRDEAVDALRAALAQPEQKPLAWWCPEDPDFKTVTSWGPGHCPDCGKQRVPLYRGDE